MTEHTLKPGWTAVKFGDVVRLNADRVADPLAAGIQRYVGLEHITPDDLRIRSWGLVEEGTTFTNYFKPGQVLFGKRRAYQRKVAVADFEGVCSSDIYVFEPKDGCLLPELLPFICQTEGFFEHAVGTSAGSLSPRTNWGQLAKYEFALPPLDEQHRIAYLLLAADGVVTGWTDAHVQANKTFAVFADNIFQYARENHGTISIGSIVSIKGGKRLPKGTSFALQPTQHPYIRIVDFLDLTVKESSLKYISNEVHKQINNYIITDDDVYISIAGTTGIVGTVPSSLSGANLTENAARLVIQDMKSHYKRFIIHYLASPQGQKSIQKHTMTTTQPKLALSRLALINIPNPSYDEQARIANILDEFFETISLLKRHLAKSKDLRTLLLNKYFAL